MFVAQPSVDATGGALDELRELARAAKESPVHAAPRKLAQIRAVHSKLVRHSVDIARKIDLSRDEQSIVSVLSGALTDLLEAMEASAGRTLLHTRTVCLAMAANRLLSVLCGSVGVSHDEKQALLKRVQHVRKVAACKSCPDTPAVSLSLLGLQLTQLESGVVCLPSKGEKAHVAMASGRVLIGAVRSFAMMKLDEELLRGTKELLILGGSAARRQFARPCYEELVLVDSLGADRKLSAKAGVSFRELLALRERNFGTYSNGRWEAKASVVWATAEALIGSSGRGIDHLDVELVHELCVGEEGGLVSMISFGDPLGETRDRAATALATLSHLGGQLVELVLDGLDGRALHEWMESLVETVHEQLRGIAESLQGALERHLQRLADAAGAPGDALHACRALHATLEHVEKTTTRVATALVRATTMIGTVEGAIKGLDEASAVEGFLSKCALHVRELEGVTGEVNAAASGAAAAISAEVIEVLAPAALDASGGRVERKAGLSLLSGSVSRLGMSMRKLGASRAKASGHGVAATGSGGDGGTGVLDDATREARRTAVHARLKQLGTLVGSMLEHGAADEADEAAMSMSTDSLMVPLQ